MLSRAALTAREVVGADLQRAAAMAVRLGL
jgi:hypothetical protein